MVKIEVQQQNSQPLHDQNFEKAILARAVQKEIQGDEEYKIVYIKCEPSVRSTPIRLSYPDRTLSLVLEDNDMVPHEEEAFLLVVNDSAENTVDVYVGRAKQESDPKDFTIQNIAAIQDQEKDIVIRMVHQGASQSLFSSEPHEGKLIILTNQHGIDFHTIHIQETQRQ